MYVAGAVEEHVENRTASHQARNMLGTRHVEYSRLNRLNILRKRRQSGHINVRGEDGRTCTGEGNCRRPSYARPCRGDEAMLFRQPRTRNVLVYVRSRLLIRAPVSAKPPYEGWFHV